MTDHIDDLVARGEIGGRTVRILESGEVDCHSYPVAPLADGSVRVRTERTAISPGTELTYIGRSATNPFLHRRWDPALRLFRDGAPSVAYPIVFGYRAVGVVVESRSKRVPEGARVFGKWRHTELTALAAPEAEAQLVPDDLSLDDALDLAQMLPIAINAVAFAEGRHAGAAAVVFGCGPIGLLTAQIAHTTGATTVFAVDRLTTRLEIAKSVGLEPIPADGDVDQSRTPPRHGRRPRLLPGRCRGTAPWRGVPPQRRRDPVRPDRQSASKLRRAKSPSACHRARSCAQGGPRGAAAAGATGGAGGRGLRGPSPAGRGPSGRLSLLARLLMRACDRAAYSRAQF